jgi:cobalt-precorrin-5B (C1)-methyltransferase
MLIIFGGTTEGRCAVEVAEAAGKPYFYSTRGEEQQVAMTYGQRLSGAMTAADIEVFCREHAIRLLIDAAHPFASQLHATLAKAASVLGLPVVRMERRYPPRDPRFIWCEDYDEVCRRADSLGLRCVLALTGVQTIARLKALWQTSGRSCWFRILPREDSRQKAEAAGFPSSHLLYYPDASQSEAPLGPLPDAPFDAMITKESGLSGGFQAKVDEALARGWKVLVVKRPALPPTFVTVTGEHGLRKQIERFVSGFFSLRSGFTTGACATAAAKAALMALLTGDVPEEVDFTIPNGECLSLPIEQVRVGNGYAEATVVKDAGDDPDVTHGCHVVARVALVERASSVDFVKRASSAEESPIRFLRGEGVGVITLPGFDYPVGEPAINKGPRAMITQALRSLYEGPLDVTLSVPGGEEMAQRTFNPRLGIEGGISILGTSGIVSPYSHEAFVQAIRRELEVAVAVEKTMALDTPLETSQRPTVVISSGGKSERYVRGLYPSLPAQAFVHYGNAIGDTLQQARELGIHRVAMGIMIGKAVKLAEGHLNTHSHTVTMNRDFLWQVAEEADVASAEVREVLDRITLARELWEELPERVATPFFHRIVERCEQVCRPVLEGVITVHLIREDGSIF